MATFIVDNALILLDGYDVSGDMNQVKLDYKAELKDDAVFGSTTKTKKGGLKLVSCDAGGYWNDAIEGVDKILFTRIGTDGTALSVSADGGVEGDVGYSFQPVVGSYQPGAQLGDMLAFSVTAEGRNTLVRGTVMHNASRTSTATGTARQLGAVSATQKLYAALHVLSVSGTTPTLDVLVQSDDAQGFATPTTKITFAQATAIGAEWATPIDGAITDTWWRVSWTIGGTATPTFSFVVVVGIQ